MNKKKKGNGEGTVFKSKNGYRGQIVVGYNEEGKPVRRSVTGKTIKEVNEKLIVIKNSLITGTYTSPDKITICELAKIILDDEKNLNYIREGTYYRHIETLKRIENNADMKFTPIQELTYTQIKSYLLNETVMSQSVINKIYLMLNKTLKEAVKRKIIIQNPMADIKKPKSSKTNEKVRALTTDEELRFYNVLVNNDIPYSWQMLLSMFTGMRMGEINALTENDINLNFKVISIDKTISKDLKGHAFVSDSPKTDAGKRIIPISDTVLPIVTEIIKYSNNGKYLFMQNGNLITTSQINMQFQRVMKKYDILDKNVKGKVSLHSLRHTFATRCIEAGMQAMALKKLLGHTDIRVTMNTYCDAFENYQKENICKADEYFANMGLVYKENNVELKA